MLWAKIHKPKRFSEITSHKEVVAMLDSFELDDVPNIVLHGPSGTNKSTIMFALLEKLYGVQRVFEKISQEIQINSTKVEITYMQSEDVVLINPSIYKNRDRVVVQQIIKTLAENKHINSFFNVCKKQYRTIIIEQAENLTKDAQAALRVTMEEYADHFKIFMICSETSKLIEPVRSRCLFFRCRKFFDDEIRDICTAICKKEGFTLKKHVIDSILQNVNGDCKRAIEILELHAILVEKDDTKMHKNDLSTFALNWEEKLINIVNLIKATKVENMEKIRQLLYEIIITNIDPNIVFLRLHQCLNKEFDSEIEIDTALKFYERMKLGMKPLFHLEAYIASVMYNLHIKNL